MDDIGLGHLVLRVIGACDFLSARFLRDRKVFLEPGLGSLLNELIGVKISNACASRASPV
jgi:hypothetical protein